MKKVFILLSLVIFFFGVQAQSCKALFIGNSYTSVNNLPELISEIFDAAGDTLTYETSAPGGCTFQQHCTVSASYIHQGDWDYVVLQEQSQLPSFPEGQFMQQSYPYAQQLCSLIRESSPNAHILFYMTWGRKDGDPQNCQYFPPLCTYEGMDSLLYLRYMMMAEDNNACVSPVGAAWHYVRDNYPDLELYQSDGSHPSYLGSYIAACSFYTMMTHQDPTSIQWNGSLSQTDADIAKNAVRLVVYDSLSKWCFEEDTLPEDSTGIASYMICNDVLSVYPNPASSSLHFDYSGIGQPKSILIYDLKGNILCRRSIHDSNVIDISFLKSGDYILLVSDERRSYAKKFTVVR